MNCFLNNQNDDYGACESVPGQEKSDLLVSVWEEERDGSSEDACHASACPSKMEQAKNR